MAHSPAQPKTLLAIGGAHLDRRGRVLGAYHPGASNPGRLTEDVGGGVFNALRNAVAAGIAGRLISVRGGDAAGAAVAQAIAAAGIEDLSAVFLDRATPSYTALITADGELIAGLADMALYEVAFAKQLVRLKARAALAAADAVLVDANLPDRAFSVLAGQLRRETPVFALAVSPAKAVRLKPLIPRLTGMFMTAREAAALAGADSGAPVAAAAALARAGLARGVITQGAAPLIGFDEAGLFRLTPPAARNIVDVTGAGDALAGVTMAAVMAGTPWRAALRRGVAAALITLESAAAAAPPDARRLAAALALVPAPEDVA